MARTEQKRHKKNYVKIEQPGLKHNDSKENGKNKWKDKPNKFSKADIQAQKAIGEGKVTADEDERRRARDLRTLYIKFTSESLPTSHDQVKELHSGIKHVSTPKKIGRTGAFSYAFLEFSNEEECVAAKTELSKKRFNDGELILDFTGEKSKGRKKEVKEKGRINEKRLMITGLIPGLTKTDLKKMFPKCNHAELPMNWKRRGNPIAFIQFSNPSDAKAAFDASQNLDIGGHKLTVLYAYVTDAQERVKEDKATKAAVRRRIKLEQMREHKKQKIIAEKVAKRKLIEESDEESDEGESEAKKAKKDVKESGDDDNAEAGDDDQESGDDDNDEAGDDDNVKAGDGDKAAGGKVIFQPASSWDNDKAAGGKDIFQPASWDDDSEESGDDVNEEAGDDVNEEAGDDDNAEAGDDDESGVDDDNEESGDDDSDDE